MAEYATDFNLAGALYSSKLAVADFDGDGRSDIILSDDYGSFHVFTLHNGSFDEFWISDPVAEGAGSVKWLGAIEGGPDKSRIYMLDSSHQLHLFSYTGYIFGETSEWSLPSEGTLIDAQVIHDNTSNNDGFIGLELLPGQKFILESFLLPPDGPKLVLASGVNVPLITLPGIAGSTDGINIALMTVTAIPPTTTGGEKTFGLAMVSEKGDTLKVLRLKGFNPEKEVIAQVAAGKDGLVRALGFTLTDRTGYLDFRLWTEDKTEGTASAGGWSRFSAHKSIEPGDVDGDGQLEFVSVGIDGFVRVLGDEPLKYFYDSKEIIPVKPAIVTGGEVYQTSAFLKQLGILVKNNGQSLEFTYRGHKMAYTGGNDTWHPQAGEGPALNIFTDPYGDTMYPLSRICIAAGQAYRFRAEEGIVEVTS